MKRPITTMLAPLLAFVLAMAITVTSCGGDDQDQNGTDPGTNVTPTPEPNKPSEPEEVEEDHERITIKPDNINFANAGGNAKIYVLSTKQDYEIKTEASWLSFDQQTGHKGEYYITITATKSNEENDRTAQVVVMSEGLDDIIITITQTGSVLYPNYNTSPKDPDQAGMTHTAQEIAALMGAGWNNGNALEIPGNETDWGNPKISQALVDAVYEAGFRNIRIPCSWNSHSNQATCEINATYMNRVKEVVDYAYNKYNDMFIVVNCHWDNGWLESNIGITVDDDINARQKALWEQIATVFQDYDERLLFASTNEPNENGKYERGTATVKTLNSYHETFINAVRSTGSKNAYRTLIVQAIGTDAEAALKFQGHNNLPKDNIADRMMFEVHYYGPYQFCLMGKDESWGKVFYYWGDENKSENTERNCGDYGGAAYCKNLFDQLKKEYVDNGIPVYVGECSPTHRLVSGYPDMDQALHDASICTYLNTVFGYMHEDGIVPVYWDSGFVNHNNSSGLFDRKAQKIYYLDFINAIRQAVGLESLPE